MTIGMLLLSPGFWFVCAALAFYAAIHAALAFKFLSAWTDDRKYEIGGWLEAVYKRIPPLGECVVDDIADRDIDFVMGFVVNTIFFLIGVAVIGAAIHFAWPLAVVAVSGYALIRGIRFARRAKKSIGRITAVAHGHGPRGKVNPIQVEEPKF